MGQIEPAAVIERAAPTIGWDGKTLKGMLEDAERVFAESGHYQGLESLPLRESDPIRYEKIWSRLRGSTVGARETALNISASPIVREIGELCFGLYTPEGDSICLSTGIMAHVHTMSEAIKHMVRAGYEDDPGIAPGDIFANNDPQLGDVHNADVQELLPIFFDGEVVGWAAGVTHEIDVGAPQPASMPIGTTSRFEDGWIISCQKVGANDRLFGDYERRIQTATRVPFYWLLDEKCRIAGCQIIRAAVLRLIEEEGLDTYKRFIREVIEDTRRAFVKNLKERTIPGTYEFPSFVDVPFAAEKERLPAYAAKDSLMHAPLEVTIGADASLDLTLEGANKWGYHSFNCTPAGIQGGLWVVLSQFLIPTDKVNDGAYLATTFTTPYGTWANPDNRLLSNTVAWAFLLPAFTGLVRALATAFASRGYLEEVIAGYPLTGNICQGGGINHYGQESAWTNFDMSSCGISARYVLDGEGSCAAVWNPEGDMGDVEAWELIEPMFYLGRRVRPNTAGMGKFRGGSGHESIRMLYGTENQFLFNLGEGYVHVGGGLFGGYPSAVCYRHSIKNTDMRRRIAERLPYPVSDRDPEASEMAANLEGEPLKDNRCLHLPDLHSEYDFYLSVLSGGNGLGDVLERDPDKVAEDLNEDFLLHRFAESAYGVVVKRGEEGKWIADSRATEELRSRMRRERLERSVPVSEWIESERSRVEEFDFIEPVAEMYRESFALSAKWTAKFRSFWNLPETWKP
jgi:N-methylhydantoinase B/acetone carboxylase alpha subunit